VTDATSDTKPSRFRTLLAGTSAEKPSGQPKTIGKRAATREALEAEARDYVRGRMYQKGGWFEAAKGFRHATGPALFRTYGSLSWRNVGYVLIWLAWVAGVAVMPVLARRSLMTPSSASGSGLDEALSILSNLHGIDYIVMGAAVIFLFIPKAVAMLMKMGSKETHAPYVELAAGIKCMPLQVVVPQSPHQTQKALTHVLNALRTEMSDLVGDGGRSGLTEVVLLEYCDARGEHMEVTARTNVAEETGRPVPAYLFLANYVAKEGRWFAENDFTASANPFKATRLTVGGSPEVDYRSVLYLPITSATRTPLREGEHGPPVRLTEYCRGVICVHSRKPYRFWR
jgi:hypothetical protein